MTQEASSQLIDKIKVILKGIDQTEIESEDGWWETSTGAKLGAEALKQILELLAQPERDYERGFIDGMQKQMQSSVDKAVNRLAQTQEPVAMWDGKYQIEFGNLSAYKHGEHSWIPLYTSPQRTEQEPFAWAEFDGEGSYFLRLYENNETYAEDWNKRNPNHIGWVEPIYKYPPQRTWVDLTNEDWNEIFDTALNKVEAIKLTKDKLKEKNT